MPSRTSKILLVEVPHRIRLLFESQRLSYSILVPDDLVQALQLIEQENIQLCVVSDDFADLETFIRNVRNSPLAADLPLLVITSSKTHEELFKLGADAFFGASDSDARFLEKIELLLGLSESTGTNVFSRRTESENPFYFALQYAAKLVEGLENETPVEHSRILPQNQSLQTLISTVEKELRGKNNDSTALEIPEGLEAIDPQGYIGHQLSVGERMEIPERIEIFQVSRPSSQSLPQFENESRSKASDADNNSMLSENSSGLLQDVESESTAVYSRSLKHRSHFASLSGGDTLAQSFRPTLKAQSLGDSDFEDSFSSKEAIPGNGNVFLQSEVDNSNGLGTATSKLDSDSACEVGVSTEILKTSTVRAMQSGYLSKLNTATSGTLEVTPFWKVFSFIWKSRISGQLRLTRRNVERHFFFEAGELLTVWSTAKEDRLVELLFREGRISEKEYESASLTISTSGRRAGVVMVEKGIISSRELFPIVRYHYESIFFDTFGWLDGEWFISYTRQPLSERIVLNVRTSSLILEAFRSVVPASHISAIVDLNSHIQRGEMEVDELNSLPLSQSERELLEWCDGKRTVHWIASRMRVNASELCALIAGLIVVNALALVQDIANSDILESRLAISSSVFEVQGQEVKSMLVFLEEKLAQTVEGTYFDIAEVPIHASTHEIRQSIQRLKSLYSEKNFHGVQLSDLQEKLAIIGMVLNEASDVLFDDKIREKYRQSVVKVADG